MSPRRRTSTAESKFSERTRFNWGYHDAHFDATQSSRGPRILVERGPHDTRHVSRQHDAAYYDGYAYGLRDTREGRYAGNSEAAWNEHAAGSPRPKSASDGVAAVPAAVEGLAWLRDHMPEVYARLAARGGVTQQTLLAYVAKESAPRSIRVAERNLDLQAAFLDEAEAKARAAAERRRGRTAKVKTLWWGPGMPIFHLVYAREGGARMHPNDAMFIGRVAEAAERIFR